MTSIVTWSGLMLPLLLVNVSTFEVQVGFFKQDGHDDPEVAHLSLLDYDSKI